MNKIDDVDEKEWLDNYQRQRFRENEKMLSKHENDIKEFSQYCYSVGVDLDQKRFSYIPTIGVVCEYPNILSKLAPDLIEDKEGLFKWDNLTSLFSVKKLNPGYFYSQKYMAMASPVFRRGMQGVNNWTPRFIDIYWHLEDQSIDAYLGLDKDRVRVNVDDSCYMELDAWYGAPFNEDISKIADGVTNLRPPSDLDKCYLDFLFSDAYALDICWSTKGNIKSFQALEFKGHGKVIKLNDQNLHPVRYIHAEYDLKKNEFRHFDGAIQYHTVEEYCIRKDSNFRHNIKDNSKIKPMSVKVFKLNGSVPVEMWTELSCHFFANNPLMYEYYSGGYPPHLLDTLEKIRAHREQNT